MDDGSAIILGILGVIVIGAIALAVIAIAAFITWHWILALGILWIARSYPVRQIIHHFGWERHAIRLWLWYLPVLVVIGWSIVMANVAAHYDLSGFLTICLMLIGNGLLVHFYYDYYVKAMPKDSDWSDFVAAAKEMELERKLAYIEQSAKLQLWWLQLWS